MKQLKKTPLRLLFEEMKSNNNHGVFMQLRLIRIAIEDLYSLERKVIETAFLHGKLSQANKENQTAEEYFKTNFHEY
jgi:hypothetical protein